MEKTIREKAFSGIVWSGIDRFSQQLIATLVRVVLARMLFPADFGLLGMLMIFSYIANVLQDSGFFSALVRKKDPSPADLSTIFYFNIGVALLLYAILFSAAPAIARFYEQPALEQLARVLFLTPVFNALGLIQSVVLVRAMDFRRNALITLVAALASGGVAIAMVYAGAGVWSLVAQPVIMSAVRSAGLWLTSDFRPAGRFSGASVRELLPFSLRSFAGSLLSQFSPNLFMAVIGKNFPAAQVGYYSESVKYQNIAMDSLSATLNSLTLPLFSSLREERERLRGVFRRMTRVAAFVALPAFMLMIAIAGPGLTLLLTDKWAAAVPLLQTMCLGAMFVPLMGMNASVVFSEGRAQAILTMQIVFTALFVAVALLFVPLGLQAMVWGWSALSLCQYGVVATLARRALGLPLLAQLKDVAPYLLLAAGCILPTMLLQRVIDRLLWQVIAQSALGVGVYFGLCHLLGSRVLRDTRDLILKKLR